jgi:DNA polymerase-3 subunit chi
MTQIDFYTHVANKQQIACILSAKALEKGLRVMIYTPDAAATEQIDRLLWTVPATGFIPHCRASDALAPLTPVTIDHAPDAFLHEDVLLNLHPQWPPFFSRFQRLIEIVGLDENDRASSRERFRFYRDRGYDIRTHDLNKG